MLVYATYGIYMPYNMQNVPTTNRQFLVENNLWQSQTYCYAERSREKEFFFFNS